MTQYLTVALNPHIWTIWPLQPINVSNLGLTKEWEMSLETYENAGIIATLVGRVEL